MPEQRSTPKTYKQVFLEAFPNAPRWHEGTPYACRHEVFGNRRGSCAGVDCADCWNEYVPEKKGDETDD